MTMFASHAPGEVIDAIRPDLEAFTSLWTALRVNYEGTNITRTVARLLHMYQPEEGVLAYERLLRTLFVLLEDFDSDGLRLLVSMVPPPKGVSEEIVKEVFNRATGFVRVDAPIFHKNTEHINCTNAAPSPLGFPYPKTASRSCSSSTTQTSEAVFLPEKSSVPGMKKTPNPMVQSDNTGSKNRMKKSPQIISQESSEVFRGFPPSEIFNTQSHAQSIKNLYRPSASYAFPQSGGQSLVNFGQIVGQNSGQMQQPIGPGLVAPSYRPKWFQSPYHLMQKNSYPVTQYQDFYLKTVNNQFVKVPAGKVNSFYQANASAEQASYQALYNNAHDYLRNRSNTVTSGLLEKIQRHRGLQEAAIKKILTECDPSKNVPRVSNVEISTSQDNVDFKVVDSETNVAGDREERICDNLSFEKSNIVGNSGTGNFGVKTCDSNDITPPEIHADENNDILGSVRNGGQKICPEFDSDAKNSTLSSKTFEEFAKEVRMRQRAIQEDIFKMDVVRSDVFVEENPGLEGEEDNSMKPEILTVSEELRNSCNKFMNRVKTEELVEVPIFPKTRSLSEIHKESGVLRPSESNLWRLLTSRNDSGLKTGKTAQDTEDSTKELEDRLVQEMVVSPVEITSFKELSQPSGSLPKRVIRRKKPEVLSTRVKSQKVIQKGLINLVANLQDDSNLVDDGTGAKPDVIMRNNSLPESVSRCSSSSTSQIATSSISPATTMPELAAYKKQYYDALLSIQKAKAAVANSLAITSVGSTPGFDPYYYSYLQQQHRQILQRHQHQILMSHRFRQQQSIPTAGTPWFRNNDLRYPLISQTRLPQRPQMLHPSSSMWPPGVGYLGRSSQISVPQRQQEPNVALVTKPPIKRRKLEEIVGKLKETESNGTIVTNGIE